MSPTILTQHEVPVVLGDANPGSAKTTTYTSTYLDLQGYEGNVLITQHVGTVGGTSPTLDGKITTCDTSGGSYSDVSGATFTQVTASNNVQGIRLNVNGAKRYIKYVGTIAGTSPTFVLGVTVAGVKKVV